MHLDSPCKIKIGTCAWSHDGWRGGFYPEHLPPGDRLAYYAERFPAVEVDSTFYGVPALPVVRHWFEATPANFHFACKMPREVTHDRRLRDCAEPLEAFVRALEPLGEKLGCVLIQLPGSFRPRQDEAALRAFLRSLPDGPRFAVEFRHADWHVPRIVHLLEEHRVCWAWTDATPLDHQREGAFEFLPVTTDFSYLRLLGDLDRKYAGDGSMLHRYTELQWPRDASLENWAARLRQEQDAAHLSRLFVMAGNHFEGFAPGTVRRLSALFGLAVREFGEPVEKADGQMELL